ncbi:MAG: S8 family serine peptidase [Myxococcales bacterium]|nr:S8 family serine peptidase [Myxococcales bacterium]
MGFKRLFWSLVITFFWSTVPGCSTDPPKKSGSDDVVTEVSDVVSAAPVDVNAPQVGLNFSATSLPRFICRANPKTLGAGTDPCPPVPPAFKESWVIRRVFEPEPALDLFPPDIETGVFCLYDWTPPLPVDPTIQLEALPTQDAGGEPLLAACEGDLPVVVPLAIDTAPDTVKTTAKDLYVVAAQQAGVVKTCSATSEPTGAPVTVAIVDSVPTLAAKPIGRPRLANSQHGTTMALLVRDFAVSSGGSCAASILQTLALDLRYDESTHQWRLDTTNGGSIGTVGSLTLATWDAIRFWMKQAKTSKLVISYSVGWSPFAAPQPIGGQGTLPFIAVKMAMEEANNRGALVLAAAGNRVAGPDGDTVEVGPMLPAGFEIGPNGVDCPAGNCQPLVFGVGAVETPDRMLALTRPKSVPSIVAWGLMGVGDAAHLGANIVATAPPFVPLSGTSVATAVAAAAAASVWADNPGFLATDVVKTLVDTGAKMSGVSVDVCAGNNTGCPLVSPSRVQICRAQSPTRVSPCVIDAKLPIDILPDALNTENDAEQSVGGLVSLDLLSPCGPDYRLWTNLAPSAFDFQCPEKQIIGYESQAYVYPQPGDPGCDNCFLSLISPELASLSVHLSPKRSKALKRPRLVLVDTKTKKKRAFDLGLPLLGPTTKLRIVGLELGKDPFDQAFLVSTESGLFGKENVIVDVLAR